nr:putative integron gene cassette protein [uncultured bacterium]
MERIVRRLTSEFFAHSVQDFKAGQSSLGQLHRTGCVRPRAFHERVCPQTECSSFQAARSMWPMRPASRDDAWRAIPTLRRSLPGAA